MNKFLICAFLITGLLSDIFSQPYQITFTGSAAATTIDSVQVWNLNQNTTLKMSGTDILVLDVVVGIHQNLDNFNEITVYPNPFSDICFLEINSLEEQQTEVLITDVKGNLVLSQSLNLVAGIQKFSINNLPKGIFFIRISSEKISFTGKMICVNNESVGPVYLKLLSSSEKSRIKTNQPFINNRVKDEDAMLTYKHMNYTPGDRLLFSGKSGNYRTIISMIPNHSQVLDFRFVPCMDYDGNHYAVVHIGGQTWMAENLKTTHYSNGSPIPNVTIDTSWANLNTGAYCDYDNLTANAAIYGHLYNSFTACDSRNAAPSGWRVPRSEDFQDLFYFLGDSVGMRLKETGLTHWQSPNACATNETGFSGLPAGIRYHVGFAYQGYFSYFWGTSYCNIGLSTYNDYSQQNCYDLFSVDIRFGCSLRCVYGELAVVSTDSLKNITSNSGIVYGNITSTGSSPVTEKGFCWCVTTDPNLSRSPVFSDQHVACGSGLGNFSYPITGLMQNNSYAVRSYAITNVDTVYGNTLTIYTQFGLPHIIINSITNITSHAATINYTIDSTGGFVSLNHGVCWILSGNWTSPVIDSAHTNEGSGTGIFTSNLSGFLPGRTFKVSAYSTNSCGTVYSDINTFSTIPVLATLTTDTLSGYTFPNAVSGGNITDDGGSAVIARGVCWSLNYPPTINDAHTSDGSGIGHFTSSVSGTNLNTNYWIRAYATNGAGTAYGPPVQLHTQLVLGQPYQGGTIGYLNTNGDHGLIAAPTDFFNTYPRWGCWQNLSIPTSTSYGTGLTNTNNIITYCTSPDIAAKICYDLVLNGYSDWFLPSIDELNKLYLNKNIIGGFCNGSTHWYWSSSESINTPVDAWMQNFDGGQSCFNKFNAAAVRAVRYF
jgi:uncharacterized protein (TIGR02145 family)